jgi:hypothetical protein
MHATKYEILLDAMRRDDLHACNFGHADHVGVAYQALEEMEFFEALALFARGIRGAAERSGAIGKFSATVTLAYMSLIAERRATGAYAGAEDFIARNPDLGTPGLLERWYSPEVLDSALARDVVVMPDRVAPAA